ncbi:hypothetical protein GBAR_LOCUS17814, partial [Geodia barretti]
LLVWQNWCLLEKQFSSALSSYSRGIQNVLSVCPSPHLLVKSTNNLGHPIPSLRSPATVKVFRMVGWPVLPPTCLLKVQTI